MEEFRELDSYYLVSNKGRIKSKRSNKNTKNTFLIVKEKGYEYITLNL